MTRASIENNISYPDLIEKLEIEYAITRKITIQDEIAHLRQCMFINNLYHYGQ